MAADAGFQGRDFGDYPTLRSSIFDKVAAAAISRYPMENDRFGLELDRVHYLDRKPFSPKEQKQAILRGDTLYHRLAGTWKLRDKSTNQILSERQAVVARVPYLTDRGTFIYNGVEYAVANQLRLRPGIYTRQRDSGELEAHFNVKPGTGRSFRVFMEPETGVFRMGVGQAKLKLYPVLQAMGVSDQELGAAWGKDLLQANMAAADPRAVDRAFKSLASTREVLQEQDRNEEVSKEAEDARGFSIKEALEKAELDPETTQTTLGKPFTTAGGASIVEATKKLLGISKGTAKTDDRDSLMFQKFVAPDDAFAERISLDSGQVGKKLLWKATFRRNVDKIPTSALTGQLDEVLLRSGLGQTLEETNPFEIYDQALRVTRMGQGGIPSTDSIPDEARALSPSHFGFIDPARTPENEKIGVDNRLAAQTKYGLDGQLYTKMLDRGGKESWVTPQMTAKAVVGFPGEDVSAEAVRAMVNSKDIRYVPRRDVDYWLPESSSMFTAGANLIPFASSAKGGRVLMAAKFFTQALPLKTPEAPLVRNRAPDGRSFDEVYGTRVGAVRAKEQGTVVDVASDGIDVKGPAGITHYPLFADLPYNRRTFLNNTPTVKVGDVVEPGKLLARSNFTDADGATAMGTNLRIGYFPYRGLTYEDAMVISESAAKKLSTEHLYQRVVENDEDKEIGRKGYLSIYPGKYPHEILKTIDERGAVKPGTVVKQGDPLILALDKRRSTVLQRSKGPMFRDSSVVWDRSVPGIVTDVAETKDGGLNVTVKAYVPVEVGNKLAGRAGDKGVVAKVIPDSEMPTDVSGKPLEMIINPLTVVSRGNPSQIAELLLGKVARKRGAPVVMPGFSSESLMDIVAQELKKEGLSDAENLLDPKTGRTIPKVMTGERFIMGLHQMAETSAKTRGEQGAFSSEELPTGGASAPKGKRISRMETLALMAHGGWKNLEESQIVRGQKNDDYWQAFRLGLTPPAPKIPLIYRKFLAHLQGAGINLAKKDNKIFMFAMTDKDVDRLSFGEVKDPSTVKHTSLEPIQGGLFDPNLTGGHNGKNWTHVTLAEPMPNPIMEDPIRRLLGLTKAKYEDLIAGKTELHGESGGTGVRNLLSRIDVDQSIAAYSDEFKTGAMSKRDNAAKVLGFLQALKKQGVHPKELVLTKVPILPPLYRPIVAIKNTTRSSSPNWLYQDLLNANKDLDEYQKEAGPRASAEERLRVYHAVKAVAGLGDPINQRTQNQGVVGLLGAVFGDSPKYGAFQRKVLGMPVEVVGRSVISPNPDLNMDQVGLPENQAWTVYRPFIIRRLVREGMSATNAAQAVAGKSDSARRALQKETENRPVLINRAPTMHKYGFMAAWPVLVKGDTLQLSPVVTKGFGADFDGDAMNYHPAVSDEAIKEAVNKMMPSKNLMSVLQFKPHYLPSQEFLYGLYLAGKTVNKKVRRTFASKEDALKAFHRGEIDIGDPVSIPGR